MNIDIRLPNITATTDTGKLQQVQSFLHQLVEQLNWALNNIDGSVYQSSVIVGRAAPTAGTAVSAPQGDDPVSRFNSIKGLIIKSADIVNAYYEKIDGLLKLSGEYVAEATFPEGSAAFVEKTNTTVNANSESITLLFTNLNEILSDIESINNYKAETKAHIQAGILYRDGDIPVVGVEIGQTVIRNGEKVFDKFARFTADRLEFYDPTAASDDEPVAYISGYNLHITNVSIKGSLKVGGYRDIVDSNGGIVTRWEGV